jgi:hypothetical protein
VTWQDSNGDILSQTTVSSSQTLEQTWPSESDTVEVDVSMEATAPDFQARIDATRTYGETNSPVVSNLRPNTTTQSVESKPVTLSADFSDRDFGTAQGDTLTVEWFVDGSKKGTTTVTSNGTHSYTLEDPLPAGDHNWYVRATDEYDNGRASQITEFTTPATLQVFNESAPSQLIDSTTLTVRFFGEGDTIVERQVTDGNVSLTGLPANERFVVTVSADNDQFYYRRIIVESLFEQEEIYLLPRDSASAEVEFRLQDYTGGQFPPASTRLYIESPVNKDFDGAGDEETRYQVIFGDTFGSAGEFATVLRKDERYRLRIANDDGDTRILGSYTAARDGIEEISVKGLSFSQPDGQSWTTNLTVYEQPRSVTWKYIDPAGETSELNVTIRASNGTVVYQDSKTGSISNYSVYQVPLANDTQYELDWNATRDGTQIGQRRPLGSTIDIRVPLDSDWLGTFGTIAVVFTLSLAGERKMSYVSMSAVMMAGVLMALKAVDIWPPLWWLAALIAVGAHLRTMQQPR